MYSACMIEVEPAYIELHCHSNFSLLDGASSVEDLVARASELGMPALALTDHDAVYGVVRFMRAVRQYDIQPILGAELTIHHDRNPDDKFHLTLLVENQTGWHNLCYLISRARHAAAARCERRRKCGGYCQCLLGHD